MRSMYGPETLLLASKKPRIKELVAKVYDMSEDEIKSLSEKPDVIKGLLQLKKNETQKEKATLAERLADMMMAAHPMKN